MNKARFQFSNVVVVDEDQIGIIVKTWNAVIKSDYSYEVYVRSYNRIVEYNQSEIKHFIYSKHLGDDEKEFY